MPGPERLLPNGLTPAARADAVASPLIHAGARLDVASPARALRPRLGARAARRPEAEHGGPCSVALRGGQPLLMHLAGRAQPRGLSGASLGDSPLPCRGHLAGISRGCCRVLGVSPLRGGAGCGAVGLLSRGGDGSQGGMAGKRSATTLGVGAGTDIGRSATPLGVTKQDGLTFGPDLTKEQFRTLILEKQTRQKYADGATHYTDVPKDELEVVEGDHKMRHAAAQACRALLKTVREDAAVDFNAAKVTLIAIASAYRSNATDMWAWRSAFATYYADTKAEREATAGGAHGKEAAQIMLKQLRAYKAPPGFSNHTNGNAVDFKTTEGGVEHLAKKRHKKIWKKTWLYAWLTANAGNFGFVQLPTEEWHWDFK